MEPWDGPAAVAFTNGRVVGATLDRNGLRPGRWVETKDGHVILGSETGMLDVAPAEVLRKGRLAPGKLFLVDLDRGRIVEDGEVKREVATHRPYAEWHRANVVHFNDLEPAHAQRHTELPLHERQLAFGFTQEDLRVLLAPMAARGEEPIGSMGNDAALAVLSDRRPSLFSYFKQLFAQVTNPPIDPIREQLVMSLGTGVGRERNLLDETPEHAHQLVMDQPILRNGELETLRAVSSEVFRAHTIDITWPVADGVEGLHRRIAEVCDEATDAITAGVNILILSDRAVGRGRVAIPSLLAVASVHHHLVRTGERLRAGLVLESGEPREVHHFATLIGYGASAINPYVLLDSVDALVGRRARARRSTTPTPPSATSSRRSARACSRRSPRWGSRRSSPTAGRRSSRRSGWSATLVERHFTGTASRIGGIGLDVLAAEALERHAQAWPAGGARGPPARRRHLRLAPRRRAPHVEPGHDRAAPARRAVQRELRRGRRAQKYDEYSRLVNEDAARRATLRGLLGFRDDLEPVALDEVEEAA